MSNYFRLNNRDLIRGLIVAVGSGIFTYLASAFNAPGFDPASIDWAYILKVAAASMVGYLGKNFLSDDQGRVFGKIN